MDGLFSSVSIERMPLVLHEPYTIAYQTVEAAENILLNIRFPNGFTAVGVSAPEEEVTGETVASTEALYNETLLERISRCKTLPELEATFPKLQDEFAAYPAALAAIDFCLLAGSAHFKNQTIAKYLKIKKPDTASLLTTITVNIHTTEETIVRIKKWMKAGFKMVKIKGGLDIEEDLRKLHAIRNQLPESLPILFDANQGYSADAARYFLKSAKKLDLIAVEQPVSKLDSELLLSLAGEHAIDIMADESARSLQEVSYLAKNGIQYFNVKLMKCGGSRKGIELAKEITSFNRKLIFSCMDECALSNAYSLLTALSIPAVKFVDLDSFTDYSHDPTHAAIKLSAGRISTPL